MNQWNVWKWNPARKSETGGWKYVETIEAESACHAIEIASHRYDGKLEAYPHIDNEDEQTA